MFPKRLETRPDFAERRTVVQQDLADVSDERADVRDVRRTVSICGHGSRRRRVVNVLRRPADTVRAVPTISLKYRFANLVVGSITRDSVKKALMNGITADQVALLSLGLLNKANIACQSADN